MESDEKAREAEEGKRSHGWLFVFLDRFSIRVNMAYLHMCGGVKGQPGCFETQLGACGRPDGSICDRLHPQEPPPPLSAF